MSHTNHHAKVDIERLSAADAKKLIIFYIENGKVLSTNFYDFVMRSQRLNSDGKPLIEAVGVESVANIPEKTSIIFPAPGRYAIFKWASPEDAETGVMRFIFTSDFMSDRKRDTRYFFSQKTAEEIAWLEAGQPLSNI